MFGPEAGCQTLESGYARSSRRRVLEVTSAAVAQMLAVGGLMNPFGAYTYRLRNLFRRTGAGSSTIIIAATLAFSSQAAAGDPPPQPSAGPHTLEALFRSHDLVVLADTKHGVRARIDFFSSPALFEAMARAGVRQLAVEMPRALGHQASSIETAADVEAFAQDVVRMGRWHFTDPDHADDSPDATQHSVAAALGRQVLLARRYGITMTAYDFNNPLGGFRTFTDPVYRCIAELSEITWVKYGLDNKISKDQRDAAIMRERLNHDDELAAYIAAEANAHGGGKLVVIAGYAHAATPNGIAKRLEQRLQRKAAIVAVFKDRAEQAAFHTFLWHQSRLLSINLSRPPQFNFSIARGMLRADTAPGRYAALDGSLDGKVPAVCYQLALIK
jgi:hypothetical protein